MILIICVDEKRGIMFNHRRQSRDKMVCKDILEECEGKKLFVTPYSGKLFEEPGKVMLKISEEPLQNAGEGDVCFIEDARIDGFEEQIQKVILYCWNRHYPADTYLQMDLSNKNWECVKRQEFKGTSHEKITKEIYIRRKLNEKG